MDPDWFDVTRGDSGHLSVASGFHFCLGAQLARLELEVAQPAAVHLLQHHAGRRAGTPSAHKHACLPVTLTR